MSKHKKSKDASKVVDSGILSKVEDLKNRFNAVDNDLKNLFLKEIGINVAFLQQISQFKKFVVVGDVSKADSKDVQVVSLNFNGCTNLEAIFYFEATKHSLFIKMTAPQNTKTA